jgi:mono/diheme cytochrome c family protein
MKRPALVALVLAGTAVVLQLVPYGRDHTNPKVTAEPTWSSPATRALAERACFDCHSNTTTWPWYSNVAPISWLVQHDTDQGRKELNFSEWDHRQRAAEKAFDEVSEGEMPPAVYLPMHSAAKLTDAERKQLAEELKLLAVTAPR